MKNVCLILLCFCIFLTSCKESTPSVSLDDPSDLKVEYTLDEGLHQISVTATANHAVEFQFDFGDKSETVSNSTGTATYTYSKLGSYTLEVRAYGVSKKFLQKTISVAFETKEPTSNVGYTTPLSYAGMNLLWQDEFSTSSLDESHWNYEIGTGEGGWGNNELQYYLKQNTTVADGYLTIQARKQSYAGQLYTSSRLTTQNKFNFQYGRVDIRALLPKGQGIWPALWMLGKNIGTVSWPACGEVDIMEMVGGEGKDNVVHGTAHWDNSGKKEDSGENKTTLPSGIYNDKFHVFSIIWDKTQIRWLRDDIQYYSLNTTSPKFSAFQKEFFLIFNVAVGGRWPGPPNPTTTFPQKMVVDYVRVFQQK